jgi:hypothetical protein
MLSLIVIPYVFAIAMILLDELVDPASKTDRSIRAGWDIRDRN